jgi:hypothetical protein
MITKIGTTMCLPLYTADSECTFSIQNQILTTKRNRLSPEISDKLIRVKIHGKGLKEKTSREFLKSGEKTVRKLKSKT